MLCKHICTSIQNFLSNATTECSTCFLWHSSKIETLSHSVVLENRSLVSELHFNHIFYEIPELTIPSYCFVEFTEHLNQLLRLKIPFFVHFVSSERFNIAKFSYCTFVFVYRTHTIRLPLRSLVGQQPKEKRTTQHIPSIVHRRNSKELDNNNKPERCNRKKNKI